MARGPDKNVSRLVQFRLESDTLYFSHYGKPFDEADVRGICGIAESTKRETAIGRFGIGFKSVYAYTKRPEIHSGDESFAIEDYVLPTPTEPLSHHDGETVIAITLKAAINDAWEEISRGLQQLDPTVLLFLRHYLCGSPHKRCYAESVIMQNVTLGAIETRANIINNST